MIGREIGAGVDTPSVDQSAARFIHAWKQLALFLEDAFRQARPREEVPDTANLLRWAERTGMITSNSAYFLDRCRQARNAYAHVVFDGYEGPVTLPPTEVVHRLERLVNALVRPPVVTAVSVKAVTCDAETPILDALGVMRIQDFSQLPYLHPERGWLLVTRDQVARWVECSAEHDAACLLDLTQSVRHVTEQAGVGPVVPRMAPTSMLLADAVDQLAQAFEAPDHHVGGYPALLVTDRPESGDPPQILAADDLPRAYSVLGR